MLSLDAASWPQYGHLEITQAVRLESRSNRSLHQFMKRPGCGENCIQKFSCFSARNGGMLYWPACCIAYKRKSWRAGSSVCSQRSTPPHPSWTQPRLHHLDTVRWIRKFPTMPLFFGRALINRGTPFPIYQANLGAQHNSQAPALLLQQQVPGALLFPKKETGRGHTHFSSTCFLHV